MVMISISLQSGLNFFQKINESIKKIFPSEQNQIISICNINEIAIG